MQQRSVDGHKRHQLDAWGMAAQVAGHEIQKVRIGDGVGVTKYDTKVKSVELPSKFVELHQVRNPQNAVVRCDGWSISRMA